MSTSPSPIEQQVAKALHASLLPDETILWMEQPLANRLGRGFAIWFFAVPWTLFALFWESMTILPWLKSSHAPDAFALGFGIVFPIFGLPFIAIGFYLLSRPIRAMMLARRTVVALTGKRLIRLVVARDTKLDCVSLKQIGPMRRRESPDGVGDLAIETHSRIDSDGDRVTERFEITGVPRVAELERLLLKHAL